MYRVLTGQAVPMVLFHGGFLRDEELPLANVVADHNIVGNQWVFPEQSTELCTLV